MPSAAITKATVWEGGDAINMARVTGADAANITQASLTTIDWAVYKTDGTVVSASASLTVSNVIFDTLQTDSRWTEDSTGYNFRHTVPAATLADGDTVYRVEYKMTATGGEIIRVTYELTTQNVFLD